MEDNVSLFQQISGCTHNSLLVDETLDHIKCKLCGEKLNPFFAIKKLMQISERWRIAKAELQLIREEINNISKVKCDNCGKNTRIVVQQTEVFERAKNIITRKKSD